MRWFEWRRQGRLLPVLALCISIATTILAFRWIPPSLFEEYQLTSAMSINSATVAFAFYVGLGIAAVYCGAYCFFQNQRIQIGPLKSFLFIRPVLTRDLASARMAATLRSVLVSVPPFVLACAVAAFFAARSDEQGGLPGFVHEHVGLDGALIAILLTIGYLAAFWCIQWVGNLLALSVTFAVGSILLWVVLLPFHGFDSVLRATASTFESEAILDIVFLGFALACAYLFHLAHRRGLLDIKNFVRALAASPFFVAGFWMIQNWSRMLDGKLYANSNIVDAIPFAIVPIATVPLVMHFARHR